MIVGCVIAYEEEALLPGCLRSLERAGVERIVVVDGAYADFPHEVPWSRDRTRAIAEAFGAEWIGLPPLNPPRKEHGGEVDVRAWVDEVEKRNAYMGALAAGDWAVVVDADERVIGELGAVGLAEGQFYALQVLGDRPAWMAYSLRIWQVPARYWGCHKAVWQKRGGGGGTGAVEEEVLLRVEEAVWVPAGVCRLAHLAALRPWKRRREKARFYAVQKRQEEAFRHEHGL